MKTKRFTIFGAVTLIVLVGPVATVAAEKPPFAVITAPYASTEAGTYCYPFDCEATSGRDDSNGSFFYDLRGLEPNRDGTDDPDAFAWGFMRERLNIPDPTWGIYVEARFALDIVTDANATGNDTAWSTATVFTALSFDACPECDAITAWTIAGSAVNCDECDASLPTEIHGEYSYRGELTNPNGRVPPGNLGLAFGIDGYVREVPRDPPSTATCVGTIVCRSGGVSLGSSSAPPTDAGVNVKARLLSITVSAMPPAKKSG